MSSNTPIIQLEKVSKCFNIYNTPEDLLKQIVMPKIQALTGMKRNTTYHQKFWALKDISFEIQKGQTVGVIGRNGSGKSTLLQIITGTMSPTEGELHTHGKIAALLELGSGFNPEFTGRENVYLNGCLLGLTRKQVDDKFDAIASFADIGEFMDQPIKKYSSGMLVRLAFAVQVAIDTEILIIDEALAVGDARFQMKCFKRMEELKSNGTTILFVSHATELVRSFCDFGLVLDKGKPIYWGDAKSATVKYYEVMFPDKSISPPNDESEAFNTSLPASSPDFLTIDPSNMNGNTFGIGGADLKWLQIHGLERPNLLVGGRKIVVRCHFKWDIDFLRNLINEDGYAKDITLGIALLNSKGVPVFGCNGFDSEVPIDCLLSGESTVEFRFELPYLADGDYFMTVAIALGRLDNHVQLRWYDCVVQLKSIKSNKNVFGIFAINYEMEKVSDRRD